MTVFVGIWVVIGIGLYFGPTAIALARGKRSAGAILALNLLLGWTFIGWVVALVWAFTEDAPTAVVHVGAVCPHCRSTIPAAASVCRFCQRDVSTTALA